MTVRSSIDPAGCSRSSWPRRPRICCASCSDLHQHADVGRGRRGLRRRVRQASPERINRRNGYRHREFDTRAGTIDVAIPKLRRAPTSRSGCWSAASGPSGR